MVLMALGDDVLGALCCAICRVRGFFYYPVPVRSICEDSIRSTIVYPLLRI